MRSQVTSRSKALTANIISNATEEDTNSSNITNTIADHYAQFDFSNINTTLKWRKKHRDFTAIVKEKFELDLKNINWNEILEIENGNIDGSLDIFLKTFTNILDKHALLKILWDKKEH